MADLRLIDNGLQLGQDGNCQRHRIAVLVLNLREFQPTLPGVLSSYADSFTFLRADITILVDTANGHATLQLTGRVGTVEFPIRE